MQKPVPKVESLNSAPRQANKEQSLSPRMPLKRMSLKKRDNLITHSETEPVKETASAPLVLHHSPRKNHSMADLISQISAQSQNLKRVRIDEEPKAHVGFRAEPLRLPKTSQANQVESDPEKTIIVELQKKLIQTEAQLEETREQVRKFSERDPKKLKELKERVTELSALVNALRQNLNLQSESLMTEGYIKFKRTETDEFVQYWVSLDYPMLKFYNSETV
jgi:hypothetical protein